MVLRAASATGNTASKIVSILAFTQLRLSFDEKRRRSAAPSGERLWVLAAAISLPLHYTYTQNICCSFWGTTYLYHPASQEPTQLAQFDIPEPQLRWGTLLSENVKSLFWKTVKMSPTSPKFSHLMFSWNKWLQWPSSCYRRLNYINKITVFDWFSKPELRTTLNPKY